MKKILEKRLGQFFVFFVSMIFVFMIYILGIDYVEKKGLIARAKRVEILENYDAFVQLENVEKTRRGLKIEGWALKLDSINKGLAIVLKDTLENKEMYFVAELEENNRVREYIESQWDFGEVGFCVEIGDTEIDFNKSYEINMCIDYGITSDGNYSSNTIKVPTGQYLCNGEIFEYDPLNTTVLESESEELSGVLQSGSLIYGNIEEGVWIYLHQNEVYWIVDVEFKEKMLEDCYVPCYIATFKQELLPEYNLIHGYDNIGFYLMDNLVEVKGEPYYFVKRTLPRTYPVAYINTGMYNEKKGRWEIDAHHTFLTK